MTEETQKQIEQLEAEIEDLRRMQQKEMDNLAKGNLEFDIVAKQLQIDALKA